MESRPNGDTVLRRIKKVSTVEWMDRFSNANYDLLKALVKARVLIGFVWAALDITPWMFYSDRNIWCNEDKASEGIELRIQVHDCMLQHRKSMSH